MTKLGVVHARTGDRSGDQLFRQAIERRPET